MAWNINTEVGDEVILALLYLKLCGENRAWKSLDWEALNRLHGMGLLHDPVNRAKSVRLTEERAGRTRWAASDKGRGAHTS